MSQESIERGTRHGQPREPVRVMLVDDHAIVRHGLRALLHGIAGLRVIGEAEDGREAVDRARALEPDVVLMDIRMPHMDGAEAARAILAERPAIRIVALSGFDVDERLLQALRAGALGYVSKNASRAQLVRAVRDAAEGRPSMPAEVTRKLLVHVDASGPRENLSDREVEILREIATGAGNRAIGERLAISEATVRTHVSNILGKLGVGNRVEATLFALRHGFVHLDSP